MRGTLLPPTVRGSWVRKEICPLGSCFYCDCGQIEDGSSGMKRPFTALSRLSWASLVAQMVKSHLGKNPPAIQETWVQSLGWEDSLEEDMATHSSILAWSILWTEEPGGLQSLGPQRFGHHWSPPRSYILELLNQTLWEIWDRGLEVNIWQASQLLLPTLKLEKHFRYRILFFEYIHAPFCSRYWLPLLFISHANYKMLI